MKNTLIIFIMFVLSIVSCSTKRTKQMPIDYFANVKYDSIFDKNKLEQVRVFRNEKIIEIRFFRNNDTLKEVIKYLEVNGRPIPNQFIFFDERGDTMKNKSLYYDLYCINDTISINEKYKFKVILTGHVFDSAALYLCNYNDKFILDSANAQCSIFSMNKTPLYTTVADKNIIQGWNYIRGRIDNYKNYKDLSGKKKNTYVSIYFIDSFYVK